MARLVKALYGHPDSGTFWERHCDRELTKAGFTPIENWPSCYWHKTYNCLLTVYVDDFKLAGPEQNMETVWQSIRERIAMDPPTAAAHYLGCTHIPFTSTTADVT